ncbi:HPr family phosphocarrier protein [Lachnospiraceae bacterium 54-53]
MYTKTAVVVNETGLHARPAGEFAQAAKQFACKITVKNISAGGSGVNGKSLVRIMGEEFSKGSEMEISADGEDEQKAAETLASLVASGLGEPV